MAEPTLDRVREEIWITTKPMKMRADLSQQSLDRPDVGWNRELQLLAESQEELTSDDFTS